MNITLSIQADNPAELQEAISGLAGIVGGSIPSPKPEEKKRTSNRKVNTSVKQVEPETEVPEQEIPEEEVSTESVEEVPTVVELRAKAQEKGKTAEGKKAIKALLDGYGFKNISEIAEEKRAEFLADLEAL